MRLSAQEIHHLIEGLNPFLLKKTAELRLFGSRLDDQQKGGDIDLLLLCESEKEASHLLKQKHLMLATIKKYLGEQKIDLVIAAKKQLHQEAFLKMVLPQSVVLHQWL